MAEPQDVYDVKRARMLLEPLGWEFIEEWYFGGNVLIQFSKPQAKPAGSEYPKTEEG